MATSDIPLVQLPDQQDGQYHFALPTRFNEDGSNVVVSFPNTVGIDDAINDIRENFPRKSFDTQAQLMTDPDARRKINVEDYKQWRADEDKYKLGNVGALEIIQQAASDIWNGAKNTIKSGYQALGALDPSDKAAARSAWNLVEGFAQGNERLYDLARFATTWAKNKVSSPFNSSEENLNNEFAGWQLGGDIAATAASRASGQLLTQGNSQFVPQRSEDELATPEDVEMANSISYFTDASMFLPVGKALELGGAAAGKVLFENVLPKVVGSKIASTAQRAAVALSPTNLVTSTLPKAVAESVAVGGKAMESVGNFVINSVAAGAEAVAGEAATRTGSFLKTQAFKPMMWTAGTIGAPLSFGGAVARAAGEIGGAIIKGASEGSARAALKEIGRAHV